MGVGVLAEGARLSGRRAGTTAFFVAAIVPDERSQLRHARKRHDLVVREEIGQWGPPIDQLKAGGRSLLADSALSLEELVVALGRS